MSAPRLAVIIATRGRRDAAADLGARLMADPLRPPDRLIYAVADPADAPDLGERAVAPPGLAAQRNAGLRALGGGAETAVFFDDDFVPASGSLAAIEQFFQARPEIAGATGGVLADGVGGAPISTARAAALNQAWRAPERPETRRIIGLYGCNMAIRISAARDLWFDERLPLYGWQEDLDFGARLSQRGDVVKTDAFAGVHLGLRAARPREAGLGYAQIANPAHLMAAGHIPRWYLARLMARNVAANHLGLLTGDPWADRRGRAWGNWLACLDALRGRLSPQRAARL